MLNSLKRCHKCFPLNDIKVSSNEICCVYLALTQEDELPSDIILIIVEYSNDCISNSFLEMPIPLSWGILQCQITKIKNSYILELELPKIPKIQKPCNYINQISNKMEKILIEDSQKIINENKSLKLLTAVNSSNILKKYTLKSENKILGYVKQNNLIKTEFEIPNGTVEFGSFKFYTNLRKMKVTLQNSIYINEQPIWNKYYRSYMLQFDNERCLNQNTRNFKIVYKKNTILQLGCVKDNRFNMDVQYPLSIHQAFSICMAMIAKDL